MALGQEMTQGNNFPEHSLEFAWHVSVTSQSFTMSGVCSFSSICCSRLSSLSLQCVQQRMRSSSFSSRTELTLLMLLMLPRREPWTLLGDWLGLVWVLRESLLALVSLSTNGNRQVAVTPQQPLILHLQLQHSGHRCDLGTRKSRLHLWTRRTYSSIRDETLVGKEAIKSKQLVVTCLQAHSLNLAIPYLYHTPLPHFPKQSTLQRLSFEVLISVPSIQLSLSILQEAFPGSHKQTSALHYHLPLPIWSTFLFLLSNTFMYRAALESATVFSKNCVLHSQSYHSHQGHLTDSAQVISQEQKGEQYPERRQVSRRKESINVK